MAKAETSRKKSVRTPMVVLLILLAIASSGGIYFYLRYQELEKQSHAGPAENAIAESERVLVNIKKLLLITETETPTIARIDEPEKIKTTNAEFYKDVQAGDYLIVYPKRAIIYRTSNNQIINFAPIVETAGQPIDAPTIPEATAVEP